MPFLSSVFGGYFGNEVEALPSAVLTGFFYDSTASLLPLLHFDTSTTTTSVSGRGRRAQVLPESGHKGYRCSKLHLFL